MVYGGGIGCRAKPFRLSDLDVVRIVFIALLTLRHGVSREPLRAIPLLAAPLAFDEILLRVLREDGLIQPLVAHHIKLRTRIRVHSEDLFTTDHIRHN